MREGRSGRNKKKLTENRLERKRATVAEQQKLLEKRERQEQKKKRKRPLNQIQPIKKPSEPTTLTTGFATLLTVILGLGFTCMMTTTFNLEMNYYIFFFALAALACGAAMCHASPNKSAPIALGAGLLFFAAVFFIVDILGARTQAEYTYAILQKRAFHGLKAYFTKLDEIEGPVTILMLILNFIPTFFTTYVVVKRRNILLSLIWYLPFLICSTIINYITPSAWACILAVAGVLLLLIFQFVRKLGDKSADERMLLITVPVLMLVVLIGLVFPSDSYDRNLVADKQFSQIQGFAKDLSDSLLVGKPKEEPTPEDILKSNGYKGSVLAGDAEGGSTITNTKSEDLSKVGYFNPPDTNIMTIQRYYNDTTEKVIMVSSNHVYLKCAGMEILEGNTWKALSEDTIRGEEAFFAQSLEGTSREGNYIIRLQPYYPMGTYFVPDYVDHFFVTEGTKYSNIGIDEKSTWDLNESIPQTQIVSDYTYVCNEVPQKLEIEWTPEYLEEIYGTCLDVPIRTRNGIRECCEKGILPEWYAELLSGERTMSTAEKVAAVVEFVRGIHPYNADTPYPPEGVDFVTWFLSESKSGFCVHYATTAAVLLRMVGVPTRYVTGYLLATQVNGTPAEVSMSDAHAWFEFFDPNYGWIIDDPTPGNGIAASYFNAYAIAKEYGDMVYESSLTPTPAPTRAPMASPTPSPELEEEEKVSIKLSDIFLHPILVVIYVLAAILLLIRLIYGLYWQIRLRTSSPNKRASAFISYFNLHLSILDGQGSRVAESIWKKSEYSETGITEKDLEKLIRFGKHNLEVQSLGRIWPRRFLSSILRVRI